jgi:APA family basic amino acid/polyamine antiporter
VTSPPVVSAPRLERRLGPLDASAIVVSNVIGAGIFITPVPIAALVPHPAGMLGVWFAGGLLAFAGAMAYAELATVRPRAGGEYVYLHDAFGPLAAFLTGWTSFVAGFSGAIAAGAVGLASYLGRFFPAAADTTPFVRLAPPALHGFELSISRATLVALSAVAILTFVHVRGLGPGRMVQNLLAATKVAALVAFIAAGLSLGHGTAAHLAQPAGTIAVSGFLLALVPVMFSYSGWNAASYVAEEIRNPTRNVPLALGIGTAAVVAIYLLLNLLYLYAMPVAEIAALKKGVVDTTAQVLFGTAMAGALAAFTIVSIAASISAMTLAGPRVYFAMARDGLLPGAAGRVHPRFRTPATAIVAQSMWTGILILSGTLSQLVAYTGFAVILFSAIAVSALFVFRYRQPDSAPPFRAVGYPWAPALFVLASVIIVVNEILRNPGTSLAGIAVMAAGVPVYWLITRRRRPRSQ